MPSLPSGIRSTRWQKNVLIFINAYGKIFHKHNLKTYDGGNDFFHPVAIVDQDYAIFVAYNNGFVKFKHSLW